MTLAQPVSISYRLGRCEPIIRADNDPTAWGGGRSARAWMPLAHDDALHKKSTPRRILGPEVHARDRGRRSTTYLELLCKVDR